VAEVQRGDGHRLVGLAVHDDLPVQVRVDVVLVEHDVVARLVLRDVPRVVGVAVPAEADRHAVGVAPLAELALGEGLELVVQVAETAHDVHVDRFDEVGLHEPRDEVVVRHRDVVLLVLPRVPLGEHLRRRGRRRDLQFDVQGVLDVPLHLLELLPGDDVDRRRVAAAVAETTGSRRQPGGAGAREVGTAAHAATLVVRTRPFVGITWHIPY
jgi:hypothetical protein